MKSVTYHRSAILYNEELAARAEALVEEVEDPEVKKWCTSVGKQHRFHAKRHKSALEKLESSTTETFNNSRFAEQETPVEAQVTTLQPADVPVEIATLAPAEVEVDVDLSKDN